MPPLESGLDVFVPEAERLVDAADELRWHYRYSQVRAAEPERFAKIPI